MRSFKPILTLLLIQFLLYGNLEAQDILVSHQSGLYENEILLSFDFNDQYQLRYTLDGSTPNGLSPNYQGSIQIGDRSMEENSIAHVPTTPSTANPNFVWKAPEENILKSTLLRYALFEGQDQVSEIFQKEYFIGSEFFDINFPIVSFYLDSLDLFGYEEGVYIPGKDYDDDPNIWQPGNYFNTGSDWEKIANISFYVNGVVALEQKVEFEIHGGGSRQYPCKSLRIKAKESLGNNRLNFPFFETRDKSQFKRVIFRNGGQQFTKAMFTDILMHDLLVGENLEIQASAQVVIFLNGSYWGIHNTRERYDKHYLEDYHGTDRDNIDYFEIAMLYEDKEGSSEDYQLMNDQLPTMDLSNEQEYLAVAEQIDIENFINHHISKAYSGGRDWSGNNERIWRPQSLNAKWRWLVNDYDDGFKNHDYNAYEHATNNQGVAWPNPEWSTRLYRSLMQNAGFASRYRDRLEEMLETTFSPQKVIGLADSLTAIYQNEMPRQIARWSYPVDLEAWNARIEEIKQFAVLRPSILLEDFYEVFPDLIIYPSDLLVYPNPSAYVLNVFAPSELDCTQLLVFDAHGSLLEENEIDDLYNQFSISNWANGLYALIFLNDREEVLAKHRLIKIE